MDPWPRDLRYICLLAVLLVSNCSRTNSQSLPVRWSPSLQLANLAEMPERLNRPFGDVFTGMVNGKQATISNCSQYLLLSKQGFQDSNNQETQVLRSDAVECVALNLLQAAKPAASTHLAAFRLTSESLGVLPPEIAPAVSDTQEAAAKAADKAGQSWKSYVPQARVTESKAGSGIHVVQPGWQIKLTEYGRADFTRAGLQEVLLRADYTSSEGTYGNSKLFLLGRNGAQGRLMLVQAVPIP